MPIPTSKREYGERVPVLLLATRDGIELCHYRLDRARVEAALSVRRRPSVEVAPEAKIR